MKGARLCGVTESGNQIDWKGQWRVVKVIRVGEKVKLTQCRLGQIAVALTQG